MCLQISGKWWNFPQFYHLKSRHSHHCQRQSADTHAPTGRVLETTEVVDHPDSHAENEQEGQEPHRAVASNLPHQHAIEPNGSAKECKAHEFFEGHHPCSRTR